MANLMRRYNRRLRRSSRAVFRKCMIPPVAALKPGRNAPVSRLLWAVARRWGAKLMQIRGAVRSRIKHTSEPSSTIHHCSTDQRRLIADLRFSQYRVSLRALRKRSDVRSCSTCGVVRSPSPRRMVGGRDQQHVGRSGRGGPEATAPTHSLRARVGVQHSPLTYLATSFANPFPPTSRPFTVHLVLTGMPRWYSSSSQLIGAPVISKRTSTPCWATD